MSDPLMTVNSTPLLLKSLELSASNHLCGAVDMGENSVCQGKKMSEVNDDGKLIPSDADRTRDEALESDRNLDFEQNCPKADEVTVEAIATCRGSSVNPVLLPYREPVEASQREYAISSADDLSCKEASRGDRVGYADGDEADYSDESAKSAIGVQEQVGESVESKLHHLVAEEGVLAAKVVVENHVLFSENEPAGDSPSADNDISHCMPVLDETKGLDQSSVKACEHMEDDGVIRCENSANTEVMKDEESSVEPHHENALSCIVSEQNLTPQTNTSADKVEFRCKGDDRSVDVKNLFTESLEYHNQTASNGERSSPLTQLERSNQQFATLYDCVAQESTGACDGESGSSDQENSDNENESAEKAFEPITEQGKIVEGDRAGQGGDGNKSSKSTCRGVSNEAQGGLSLDSYLPLAAPEDAGNRAGPEIMEGGLTTETKSARVSKTCVSHVGRDEESGSYRSNSGTYSLEKTAQAIAKVTDSKEDFCFMSAENSTCDDAAVCEAQTERLQICVDDKLNGSPLQSGTLSLSGVKQSSTEATDLRKVEVSFTVTDDSNPGLLKSIEAQNHNAIERCDMTDIKHEVSEQNPVMETTVPAEDSESKLNDVYNSVSVDRIVVEFRETQMDEIFEAADSNTFLPQAGPGQVFDNLCENYASQESAKENGVQDDKGHSIKDKHFRAEEADGPIDPLHEEADMAGNEHSAYKRRKDLQTLPQYIDMDAEFETSALRRKLIDVNQEAEDSAYKRLKDLQNLPQYIDMDADYETSAVREKLMNVHQEAEDSAYKRLKDLQNLPQYINMDADFETSAVRGKLINVHQEACGDETEASAYQRLKDLQNLPHRIDIDADFVTSAVRRKSINIHEEAECQSAPVQDLDDNAKVVEQKSINVHEEEADLHSDQIQEEACRAGPEDSASKRLKDLQSLPHYIGDVLDGDSSVVPEEACIAGNSACKRLEDLRNLPHYIGLVPEADTSVVQEKLLNSEYVPNIRYDGIPMSPQQTTNEEQIIDHTDQQDSFKTTSITLASKETVESESLPCNFEVSEIAADIHHEMFKSETSMEFYGDQGKVRSGQQNIDNDEQFLQQDAHVAETFHQVSLEEAEDLKSSCGKDPMDSASQLIGLGGNMCTAKIDEAEERKHVAGTNVSVDVDGKVAENVKAVSASDKDFDPATFKRMNRSVMIHGTPRKPPLPKHDMKENMTARKRLQVNATAVKPPAKRKALEKI